MLIETWIAVLIVVFLFISNLVLVLSGLLTDQRLDDERKINDELREENYELRHYIAVQRTKSIIGVANDFNNEGNKK